MAALRSLALTFLVFTVLVAASDRIFLARLAPPARLDDNFSPAFLRYTLARLHDATPATVVLGDSVLWGYDLAPSQTAVSLLRDRGIDAVNLAYEGGSPVNTYAMLEALKLARVEPRRVVFNVNEKTFNASDGAYATVRPSVLTLISDRVSPADAALFANARPGRTAEAALDDAVCSVWQLYAMRSDVREALFGDVDAAHALAALLRRLTGASTRAALAHKPAPERFEGTYDLTPLDERNVSVHFLERGAALLRAQRIPAIAILTPTNHALLHEYVDNPQYARNLAYVRTLLERRGVRVVDLDRAFRVEDFIDNDHLTARANARLANLIAAELAEP